MKKASGFTLIETLVATLVGALLVTGAGLLTSRLLHTRASNESLDTASNLALKRVEKLKSLPNPDPSGGLTAGPHGPFTIDSKGNPSLGPFQESWTVVDNVPYTGAKRITVAVRHLNNPFATTDLVTHHKLPSKS